MRHLFLADDNLTTQMVFQSVLSEEGVEVRCFDNVHELLVATETDPVDLAAVNVSVGGEDGYEVCRQLKERPGLGQLPVILLVGAFQVFDESRAGAVGCDHRLVKPFETAELRKVVRGILSGIEQKWDAREAVDLKHSDRRLFDLMIASVKEETVFDLGPDQCRAGSLQLEHETLRAPSTARPAPVEAEVPARAVVASDKPGPLSPDQLEWIVERLLKRLPDEFRRVMLELRKSPGLPD